MSSLQDHCENHPVEPRSRIHSGLLRAIHWYQVAREGRPSPCRFWPSCSEYAMEAISVHGSGRGTWLAIRRLSRCRPFGPSGVDPVPAPKGHI
jgi:putative membrane protein insertion efficiency factor